MPVGPEAPLPQQPEDRAAEVVARVTARPVPPAPTARRAGMAVGRSVARARAAVASPAARTAGKRAAGAAASRYFAGSRGPVGKLLQHKDQLLGLATRGEGVAGRLEAGTASRAGTELRTLLRLIRAYATGGYRDVPVESMALVVAAVAYVVSPLDLIPEFIPGIGGLDDLTVLTFALRAVRTQLDAFVAWEQATEPEPEPGAPPALPPAALPPPG